MKIGSLGQILVLTFFLCLTAHAQDSRATAAQASIWRRHTIDDSSRGADGVKLGDINQDGWLDIVTGWEEGGEVHVCLNPGPARAHNRWPSIIVGHAPDVEDAIFVDLNNDGLLEILSCTEGKSRTVFLHQLSSSPRATRPNLVDSQAWNTREFPATQNQQAWMQATTMNVDGQQGVDVVLASKNAGGSIGWLQAPADSSALDQWKYHQLRSAGWIMSLETVDINRDGNLDIVFSDRKGKRSGLYWLENPGAATVRAAVNKQIGRDGSGQDVPRGDRLGIGGAQWKEHAIGAIGREVMFADIADINTDGLVDIVVAVKPIEVVICFQKTNGGWREQSIELEGSQIGDAKAVKVLDINRDGLLDICFTCENAHNQREGILWLQQMANGQWRQQSLGGPDGVKFDLMQTMDVDGDGDLDIITCEERDQLGVVWYENPHVSSATGRSVERPRLAILTDIGGDPDDLQSLIRLMTFANEFEIEALVASASGTRGELKESVTRPDLIRTVVQAYGQVLPNLQRHAQGWPTESHLASVIKSGNPHRERAHIGEAHDTEGSVFLTHCIDAGSPERPLNIAIWGGQTDLGQVLWRAKQQRTNAEFAAFVAKFRVYDINDQDGIADWLRSEFPGLNYILAKAPSGRDKREGTYRGMYLTGDESLTSLDWVEKNILSTGPLGALYPTKTFTAPNPHACIKEGDTPSWFFFLPLGGNDPSDPSIPGWGGQFIRSVDGWWRDQPRSDNYDPRTSVSRWRTSFQAEFAKRMQWCR